MRRVVQLIALLLSAYLAGYLAGEARAAFGIIGERDWNQWRGPSRDGQVAGPTCINLRTGERTWTSKPFGKYASLVAQRDRILALDERGVLLLIKANPKEFELLSEKQISEEETWAHLAVSGDELFIRELNALAAYRWRTPEGQLAGE